MCYGVASVSRIDKIIGLFCRIAEYSLFCRSLLQKRHIILSILLTKANPYAGLCSGDAMDAVLYSSAQDAAMDAALYSSAASIAVSIAALDAAALLQKRPMF